MEDDGENYAHTSVPLNGPSDFSQPLAGVVLCCTSVSEDLRTRQFEYAKQMGAICEYDLTNDVTHLIVGELYNTPKYRYVAKERPDVKPMGLGWIEALRELWIKDEQIDAQALETEHTLPTLHSLKFSMTGCDDTAERQTIAEAIEAHGAVYAGDLTKSITHLISFRTEGAKYKAAKSWKIRIVSIEWLRDSLERGMVLDEALYDPNLPQEERGKGAWDRSKPKRTSLGKRAREDGMAGSEGGKRKLRRTASTKLNSQSESMWGQIVGGGSVVQVAQSGQWEVNGEEPTQPNDQTIQNKPEQSLDTTRPKQAVETEVKVDGIFNGSRFYFYGFTPTKTQVLCSHLVPHGAEIYETIDDLRSVPPTNTSNHTMMIVPHDLPLSEHPELPQSQLSIETVTDWWVERCLHQKKFTDPAEHIIGRPFQVFPIEGFVGMMICSSAFSGIDLLHFKKAVELLGATYSEDMTPQSSVLVNKSLLDLRKDKLDHALQWKIPIVGSNWLWDCIKAGTRLSMKNYRCRPQKRSDSMPGTEQRPQCKGANQSDRPAVVAAKRISRGNSISGKHAKPPRNSGFDDSAFAPDEDVTPNEAAVKEENDSCNIQALPEASPTLESTSRSEPLSERNPNSSSKTVSTAPAPSNHPAVRPPQEDISNAISDLISKTKTAIQPTLSEPPEGRKRSTHRILGRVASNMSATSNHSRATSVDSTATHGHPVEYPPYDSGTNEQMEMLMNGDRNTHKSGDSQPPPTQLQYEDPESEAVSERVMARMLGENAPPPKRKGLREKAVTIGDFEPKARATRQGKTGLR
ncbi:S-M checkpoint control protein rad4 [Lachnellula cervina]|uniref:S-M checkpoint control protein rad4 n=1 Tax=Lachnellula cervina TaxID=1316786 RepID=A0A7D8UTW2_9HELO|nr:S-M checkpoint control protein rad4 [Lachnellula cervina]